MELFQISEPSRLGAAARFWVFGRGRPICAFVGVDMEYLYRRFSGLNHRKPMGNFHQLLA